MVNQREREAKAYNEGYTDANAGRSNGGSALGVVLGAVIVFALGAGAYFMLADSNRQSTDGPDVINVPAPESPDVNVDVPEPRVPDVNVDVPEPQVPDVNVDIPKIDLNSSEGSGSNGQTSSPTDAPANSEPSSN